MVDVDYLSLQVIFRKIYIFVPVRVIGQKICVVLTLLSMYVFLNVQYVLIMYFLIIPLGSGNTGNIFLLLATQHCCIAS